MFVVEESGWDMNTRESMGYFLGPCATYCV
jgi:hypothetical protein